jgi:hypothetical protein
VSERKRLVDEITLEARRQRVIREPVGAGDVGRVVDLVRHPGEALMGPGVGIDVHGDAEPVEGVPHVAVTDHASNQVVGDRAVRPANELLDEWTFRVLPGRETSVSG